MIDGSWAAARNSLDIDYCKYDDIHQTTLLLMNNVVWRDDIYNVKLVYFSTILKISEYEIYCAILYFQICAKLPNRWWDDSYTRSIFNSWFWYLNHRKYVGSFDEIKGIITNVIEIALFCVCI